MIKVEIQNWIKWKECYPGHVTYFFQGHGTTLQKLISVIVDEMKYNNQQSLKIVTSVG